MIKKEILELIEYRDQLIKSQYGDKTYSQTSDILDLEIPLIPELQEECGILEKELESIKNKKRAALNYIKTRKEKIDKINCTHPLIFPSQGGGFNGYWVPNECVLCRKSLQTIDDIESKVEIEKDINDEDGFVRNYNFFDLYPLLIEILKKYKDNDEVDLNNEFLGLYNKGIIGKIKINEEEYRKTYNILILGGSNRIKIEKDIYITHQGINNTIKILEYLEYIRRCHLEVIMSIELEYLRLSRNTEKYTTLNEFLVLLNSKTKNKYDLIINVANLFDYKIENGKIIISNPDLNLQNLFPNTPILDLNNYTEIDIELLLNNIITKENMITEDLKKLLLKK